MVFLAAAYCLLLIHLQLSFLIFNLDLDMLLLQWQKKKKS